MPARNLNLDTWRRLAESGRLASGSELPKMAVCGTLQAACASRAVRYPKEQAFH